MPTRRPRQAELAAAELSLRAADGVLDTAREALAAAEQARGQAAAGWRDLRRSADAVEAEIRVLESLAPETDAGGLLDRLEVPEELAAALAAALGDDLLAGTDRRGAALLAGDRAGRACGRRCRAGRGPCSSWSARPQCCTRG